jgi:hypothetical protein
MKVAIHQPNFLPWLGFFYKIMSADVFVLLDTVQFSKNSFINRNKIKTPEGSQWITVPVIQSGLFGQPIRDVSLFSPELHLRKIRASIVGNYRKSKFFGEIWEFLEPLLTDQAELSLMNESLIRACASYMNLPCRILRSSDLGISGEQSTDLLVQICKRLGAQQYLAGFGSQKYQEDEKFRDQGIGCFTYDFVHPVYPQLWGDFIPNQSVIDLLFNMGPEASACLKGIQTLEKE